MIENSPPEPQELSGEPRLRIENAAPQVTRHVEGAITKQIGSGEYAKDTFIYITIFWSFIIGSATCAAIYVRTFTLPEMTAQEIVEVMKGVWAIFLPIITLALGYSFGKGR